MLGYTRGGLLMLGRAGLHALGAIDAAADTTWRRSLHRWAFLDQGSCRPGPCVAVSSIMPLVCVDTSVSDQMSLFFATVLFRTGAFLSSLDRSRKHLIVGPPCNMGDRLFFLSKTSRSTVFSPLDAKRSGPRSPVVPRCVSKAWA